MFQYRQAAYICLASIITLTQHKESFFVAFLFKENILKGEYVWDNIVSPSDLSMFTSSFDEIDGIILKTTHPCHEAIKTACQKLFKLSEENVFIKDLFEGFHSRSPAVQAVISLLVLELFENGFDRCIPVWSDLVFESLKTQTLGNEFFLHLILSLVKCIISKSLLPNVSLKSIQFIGEAVLKSPILKKNKKLQDFSLDLTAQVFSSKSGVLIDDSYLIDLFSRVEVPVYEVNYCTAAFKAKCVCDYFRLSEYLIRHLDYSLWAESAAALSNLLCAVDGKSNCSNILSNILQKVPIFD